MNPFHPEPSPWRVLAALELSEPYAQAILRGIIRGAGSHPRVLLQGVSLSQGDRFADLLRHCDGVIVSMTRKETARQIQECLLPAVNVSTRGVGMTRVSVTPDLPAAARVAVAHFRSRKIKHFAYYGPDKPNQKDPCFQGIQQVVQPGETFHGTVPLVNTSRTLDESTVCAFLKWFQGKPVPMGLVCLSDDWGAHAVEMCRMAGIRVPAELAVVGLGNNEVAALSIHPAVSSVEMHHDKVGETALELLVRLLEGKPGIPEHRTLPPGEVVVRAGSDTYAVDDLLVATALRLLDRRVNEPFDINVLSLELGVSRRILEHRFLRHMGETPASYLRERRIEASRLLLTETDQNITDIARACGFANAAHFCTLFRKQMGQTPKGYRDRQRQHA